MRQLNRRRAILEVRRRGFEIRENRYSTKYLARYGFQISTLIDVGVYKGSPAIYELFPTAELLLIDPIPGAEELVLPAVRGRRYKFVEAAAGAADGTATFYVDENYSSLHERPERAPAASAKVEVKTLDSIVSEAKLRPPFGLKIDTEGHDLDVIKGAIETLAKCEFALVETNIRRRFPGSYLFSDMILLMHRNGFEVADTITPPHHNRYADVLFVRSDHPSLQPGAVIVDRF